MKWDFYGLISHICFCVPFVVLNVMPRIKRMDQSIYDAALDLGCNQWQAFYKVIIHELMPGIFSGLLMSFTYSLDDFIITYFTRGAKFQNLSIEIYSMTHRRIFTENQRSFRTAFPCCTHCYGYY